MKDNAVLKLAAVPSLEQVTADPHLLVGLTSQVLETYLVHLATLQPLVMAELIARRHTAKTEDDPLITKETVAVLTGMSVSWVEKHADKLPPRRSVAGAARWVKSEIVAWAKARPLWGIGD